jgi:hypothetical protein
MRLTRAEQLFTVSRFVQLSSDLAKNLLILSTCLDAASGPSTFYNLKILNNSFIFNTQNIKSGSQLDGY